MNCPCEQCMYGTYDEEFDEWDCAMELDEDDYAALWQEDRKTCPFFKAGDEYMVVRHQM